MKGEFVVKCLSDQLLIEAHEKAIKLKLNNEFIRLLKNEMNRRNLIRYTHHETPLSSSQYTSRLSP